jgi:hypothetical protein
MTHPWQREKNPAHAYEGRSISQRAGRTDRNLYSKTVFGLPKSATMTAIMPLSL